MLLFYFVYGDVDHRDLHVLTHSFPTRRSSDLAPPIIPNSPPDRGWCSTVGPVPVQLLPQNHSRIWASRTSPTCLVGFRHSRMLAPLSPRSSILARSSILSRLQDTIVA